MTQFVFMNKVWIRNAPRKKAVRIVLMIFGILLFLFTLFQILMGDADEINWGMGIIFPIVLIIQGFLFMGKGQYLVVHTIVECLLNEVRITFNDINRFDGAGVRSERFIIRPNTIIQFQYSRSLTSIRIIAYSVNGETPVNEPEYEVVLYPPVDEIQALISALEHSFGHGIMHMDT